MSTEAWVVPTEAGCKDYLAAAGISSFTTGALGAGQTNPFPNVMAAVVKEIRGYIRSCERNVLSETENSVPPELERTAYLMIVEAMQGRLPGVNLTKGQETALKNCREILSMVAKCDFIIANPTDPAEDTAQRGAASTIVTSSERIVSRAKMNGLC